MESHSRCRHDSKNAFKSGIQLIFTHFPRKLSKKISNFHKNKKAIIEKKERSNSSGICQAPNPQISNAPQVLNFCTTIKPSKFI